MTMVVNMAYVPKPESGTKVLKMTPPLNGSANQGWKKYFIFWDRNEKWENFLQVVDTNPV
jgi:hypothetical protein